MDTLRLPWGSFDKSFLFEVKMIQTDLIEMKLSQINCLIDLHAHLFANPLWDLF